VVFGLPSFARRAKPQEQKPWNVTSARLPHGHYCKLGRVKGPNIPLFRYADEYPPNE